MYITKLKLGETLFMSKIKGYAITICHERMDISAIMYSSMIDGNMYTRRLYAWRTDD